nr:reverse transcriptase domain-containing protein [Tanacetum cinerariifolium]
MSAFASNLPRDVTFNEDVIINSGNDFVPPHNVDNNHTEGKVEFEFDVENSIHTQPLFNNEHIETQDDGNMPTSPQSQPQTEYLLARDRERVESNWYKARYVVRGFDQREGIDFNEVFSLIVCHTSIRLLLFIVALQDLELEQLDVKTTFLHGHLEEEIYVEQPKCFKVPGKEDHTYSITDRLHFKILKKFNIRSCKPVPTPLAPHFKLSSHECPKSEEDKEDMSRVSYSSAVGSLMYAMICTRPDLAHGISVVSRYMHNPGKMHWEAVKSITTLSTIEAEYISSTKGVKEAIWLREMVNEFGLPQEGISKQGFDPQLLVEHFNPVGDNTCVLEFDVVDDSTCLMLFEDVREVMNNNHNLEPPPQNGPPPMVRPNGQAPRTMEELCQLSINGQGGPIAPIPIQAIDFGLRHHMIQQEFHHSFDDMMRKFLSKYFPPSMVTKLRNEITKYEQKPHESLFEACECYKLLIDRCPNHNMLLVTQIDTFYNGLTLSHQDTINVAPGGTFMQKSSEECYELIENMTVHHNHSDTSAIRDETSRNISSTSTTESPEVVRQLEMMNKFFSKMMRQFQTIKAVDTKCELVVVLILLPSAQPLVATLKRLLMLLRVTIIREVVPQVSEFQAYMKANDVVMKNIKTQMTSLTNSNLELKNMCGQFMKMNTASSSGTGSLTSNAVPNPREDLKAITTRSGVTLAGPSVSLPPLSKESSPASTSFSTISSSKMPEVTKDTIQSTGIAEDIFVKVGKFHFPTDFVVVDYVVDPRVLLILGRPFLWTGRALIDVYSEELTLRVDDEAITFKVGQTLKYSYNDAESIDQIDVIDVACEEYVQDVLGFFDNSKSGNPTPTSDPIIAFSSPSLTPFEGGDFILEEIKACLTSELILPGIDDTDLDLEGDIRLLEELLNNDPSLSPLPSKELNVEEIKTVKSSVDEPP